MKLSKSQPGVDQEGPPMQEPSMTPLPLGRRLRGNRTALVPHPESESPNGQEDGGRPEVAGDLIWFRKVAVVRWDIQHMHR